MLLYTKKANNVFYFLCEKDERQRSLATGGSRLACKCLIHREPARHRFFPSFGEGALQQLHLFTAQRLLEPHTFLGQFQQAFALVGLGRNAVHQVHLLQLA